MSFAVSDDRSRVQLTGCPHVQKPRDHWGDHPCRLPSVYVPASLPVVPRAQTLHSLGI